MDDWITLLGVVGAIVGIIAFIVVLVMTPLALVPSVRTRVDRFYDMDITLSRYSRLRVIVWNEPIRLGALKLMGVSRQPARLAAFMRVWRLGGRLVGQFQSCILEVEGNISQTVDPKEYQTCYIEVARWSVERERYVIGLWENDDTVVLDQANYRVLVQIVASGQNIMIDRRFSVRDDEIDWVPDVAA